MKSLFLLFSFVLVASFSANAQACNKAAGSGKACCASKKTAAVSQSADTKVASVVMEADAAVAASNGSITKELVRFLEQLLITKNQFVLLLVK
ncbi:MAG: hypothetical protein IPG00_07025 [Saprospiraceae bacterium]|nr:hypothetical protein [Saprospiraceae bacterium]